MRIVAALLGCMLSLSAFAQTAASFQEGKDYVLLSEPIHPADPTRIEVAEMFSYACPHCYDFESDLSAWAKKQPADVVLVQTHAAFRADWVIYQRGYYTVLSLGLKEKAHDAIFKRVHAEHKEFADADDWANFLAPMGVDKQKVISTFNSFGVNTQMKQADNRIRDFKVSSTPQMFVDGKYKIAATKHEDMLKVAQFLVDKIRAERAATKH